MAATSVCGRAQRAAGTDAGASRVMLQRQRTQRAVLLAGLMLAVQPVPVVQAVQVQAAPWLPGPSRLMPGGRQPPQRGNRLAPLPQVMAVQTEQQRYVAQAGLQLPRDTHTLRIDFMAATLALPQRVQYRYRLIGQDRIWRQADSMGHAWYADLGPGEYRFELLAGTDEGGWSPTPASLRFAILPAWYQGQAFQLAAAMLLLGAGCQLFWWRRRLRARRLQQRHCERRAEREQIARTLHDTFLQSVQGLILRFHSIKATLPHQHPVQRDIDAALDAADAVVHEGRQQLLALRRESDRDAALAPALQQAASALCMAQGVRFTVRESGQRRALQRMVHEELLAIASEAIVNSLRHAACRQLDVELDCQPARFTLRIHDDGAGIDSAVRQAGQRPGHWGLTGMRERAQRIDGRFQIDSAPASGTTITVSMGARQAYVRPAARLH